MPVMMTVALEPVPTGATAWCASELRGPIGLFAMTTYNDEHIRLASVEFGDSAEIIVCANKCGNFYVTQRDSGPKIWTCPACDEQQYDAWCDEQEAHSRPQEHPKE